MELIAIKVPKEIEGDDYNYLYSKVSLFRQNQCLKYHQRDDAYRSILGECLVRLVIIEQFNMKNNDISFEKNQFGKPYWPHDPAFAFNVSHSGKWVVVLWGLQTALGVDVEEIKPVDLKIAKRFFSSVEYDDLLAKPEQDRIDYFYELWTLKESFIKATGKGLSTHLNHFTIRMLSNVISVEPNNDLYFLRKWEFQPSYKLAACSNIDMFPDSIKYMDVDKLRRTMLMLSGFD